MTLYGIVVGHRRYLGPVFGEVGRSKVYGMGTEDSVWEARYYFIIRSLVIYRFARVEIFTVTLMKLEAIKLTATGK